MEFGMIKCKDMATPMKVHTNLPMKDSSPLMNIEEYRNLVTNLIFLCDTRPSINFVAGVLDRFSNKPQENH